MNLLLRIRNACVAFTKNPTLKVKPLEKEESDERVEQDSKPRKKRRLEKSSQQAATTASKVRQKKGPAAKSSA